MPPRSQKIKKLTDFGQFVVTNKIDPEEAAAEIGCNAHYFAQIMHERPSVSLRMAARIAVWAKRRGLEYSIEKWEGIGDAMEKLQTIKRTKARPKPQLRTVFGKVLDDLGISFGRAAGELGVSRQHLHKLAVGKQEVSLPLAVKIAGWAKKQGGDVPVESWPNVDFAMKAAKG